jgi:tetratricopeptide (TPR) repeat protein
MRLAIIASSGYGTNVKLEEERCAPPSQELLSSALNGHWEVETYELDRPFPDLLERALYSGARAPSEILLYACGLVALADGRPPALVLDGERLGTLALGRLRRLLDRVGCPASLVIDGKLLSLNGGTADDALAELDVELGAGGSSALVGLRVEQAESAAPTLLARTLAEVLGNDAAHGGADPATRTARHLNGESSLKLLYRSRQPSAAPPSPSSLPPPAPLPSLRVPSPAPAASSLPPPSLPPLRPPPGSPPPIIAPHSAQRSEAPERVAREPSSTTPGASLPPLPILPPPAANAPAALRLEHSNDEAVPSLADTRGTAGAAPLLEAQHQSSEAPRAGDTPVQVHHATPESEQRPEPLAPESEHAAETPTPVEAPTEAVDPAERARIARAARRARSRAARARRGAAPLDAEPSAHALPPLSGLPSGAPLPAPHLPPATLPPPSLPPLPGARPAVGSTRPPPSVAPSERPPESDPAVKAMLARARELEAAGDANAATDEYKRALLATQDRAERAQIHLGLGRCARALDRPAVALGNFQKAAALDLGCTEALGAARELLEERQDWSGLANLCELVASRHVDEAERATATEKLAMVFTEHVRDPELAAKTWARIATTRPNDVVVKEQLARSQAKAGAAEAAVEQCRGVVALEPRRVAPYQIALEAFQELGLHDHAFGAASALDYLGAADINDSLIAAAHRPENLLPVKNSLAQEDWRRGGLLIEPDDTVRLLELVAEPAMAAERTWLKKKKALPNLTPEARHDTQASTTTLAKSLLWAARLLEIGEPALYLVDDVPAGLRVVPAPERIVVAGRSVASGVSLPELAFLWGRKLALLHPEHYLLVHFPRAERLTDLVAALSVATGLDASATPGHVKHLSGAFKRRLDAARVDEVRALLNRGAGAAERLRAWARAIELSAVRAGLVSCGHLQFAAELTQRFAFGGETTPHEQVGELLRYSISEPYAGLRRHLGVSVTG